MTNALQCINVWLFFSTLSDMRKICVHWNVCLWLWLCVCGYACTRFPDLECWNLWVLCFSRWYALWIDSLTALCVDLSCFIMINRKNKGVGVVPGTQIFIYIKLYTSMHFYSKIVHFVLFSPLLAYQGKPKSISDFNIA